MYERRRDARYPRQPAVFLWTRRWGWELELKPCVEVEIRQGELGGGWHGVWVITGFPSLQRRMHVMRCWLAYYTVLYGTRIYGSIKCILFPEMTIHCPTMQTNTAYSLSGGHLLDYFLPYT